MMPEYPRTDLSVAGFDAQMARAKHLGFAFVRVLPAGHGGLQNMFVITVALFKGGVSKTSTAIGLAEMASYGGKVTLIDADPQSSAYRWSMLAAGSGHPLRSTVVPMHGTDLARRIESVASSADLVVVDSPPPGDMKLSRAAIAACDYCVVPTVPEMASLDRVASTVEVIREHGKSFRVVLTQVRAGLADRDGALAALRAWGLPTFATEMPLTIGIARNYGHPLTGNSPLARYSFGLLTEILKEVHTSG